MSNHTGRLVLTTVDPLELPNRSQVMRVLAAAGLVGAPLAGREDAFAAGPELTGLLVFAGCAVTVPTQPGSGAGGGFCHVRVPAPSPMPRLLVGRNSRAPRCPGCRTRLQDWRDREPGWREWPHLGVTCPVCGATRPAWGWDWKRQGGCGRLFVLVEEIFPGEAVPSPTLLEWLNPTGGSGWRYFYVQD